MRVILLCLQFQGQQLALVSRKKSGSGIACSFVVLVVMGMVTHMYSDDSVLMAYCSDGM